MGLAEETQRIIRDIENPDGKGMLVVFYDKDIVDKETGDITTRTYVQKRKDALSIYDCPAYDEDKEQHAHEYQLYLRAKTRRSGGTELRKLSDITVQQIQQLEASEIYTIEELAVADDFILRKAGALLLRDEAQEFGQGSDKDQEIADLKAEIERLKNVSSNNGAKRRGRKPAVRETGDSGKQQQQGDQAGPELSEEG